MSTRSKGLDAFLGLVLSFFVFAPLEAIMTSATATQLWNWFIKGTYGSSPSLGVWYGLAAIYSVAKFSSANYIREVRKDDDDDIGPIAAVFVQLIVTAVVMVFALISGWIVKNMLGW